MRVAVYCRLSLDRTGEELGVERQRQACGELIARHGWTLAETFTDNSVSAAGKRHRPGFEALLDAVQRGEVDMVVAWALDRLTRNRRDEVRLVEACKAAGVSITLVRGPGLDLSSAVGRAIAEVLATFGRMENEQKAERQRAAFAQQRAQGRPWGPIPAFGYADDRVTVVRAEAKMIRAAYSAVLSGASCRGIAAQWNAAGSVTRTGKAWSGAAVKRVLINPRYAGIRATTVGAGNRRDLIEVGPGTWDAIVTEDVWRAAHALLTDPTRRTTDVRVRVHLLPGIASCGRCGAPMRSRVTDRGKTVYRCSAAHHLSRDAEHLNYRVTEVVLRLLARPDVAAFLRGSADEEAAAAARTEVVALRARLDDLTHEFTSGEIESARELREVRETLRGRLADAEAALADAGRRDAFADLPLPGDDIAAWWELLDLERQRMLIAALVTVTVLPSTQRGPGAKGKDATIAPRF